MKVKCKTQFNFTAPSTQSPAARDNSEDFTTPIRFMHEMGLLDDALNMRALIICAGELTNEVFLELQLC